MAPAAVHLRKVCPRSPGSPSVPDRGSPPVPERSRAQQERSGSHSNLTQLEMAGDRLEMAGDGWRWEEMGGDGGRWVGLLEMGRVALWTFELLMFR